MFKDDSDVNERAYGRLLRRASIGDPKVNGQQFDEVSPLKCPAGLPRAASSAGGLARVLGEGNGLGAVDRGGLDRRGDVVVGLLRR